MLLCGVVIEGCIQDQYDNNTKGEIPQEIEAVKNAVLDDTTREEIVTTVENRMHKILTRSQHVAIATLIIAWVTFALIWFVIITQFWRQADTAGQCDKCASYPAVCPVQIEFKQGLEVQNAIISVPQRDGEFIQEGNDTRWKTTLSYFNVTTQKIVNSTETPKPVEPCTVCPTTGKDNYCQLDDESKCTGRTQIPSAVSFIVASQCLAFALFGVVLTAQFALSFGQHGERKVKSAWYTVSMVYAVLSVTAKTSLEIGFLVMLSQMPESTVRA